MSLDPKTIRRDFPNLDVAVRGKPLVYFDNAATTLKPNDVIDAVSRHYREETSNVHRGVHTLSEQATAHFEAARDKVRAFLNASSTKEIIFTKGTTESINLVAHAYGEKFCQPGDDILITGMEHHSNIVPWQILCEQKSLNLKVLPIDKNGELCLDRLDSLLTDNVKLVALVHVSNSLGTVNPVHEVVRRAREKGAHVLIDGAQAVSHLPVDVQQLDCDFYAFSGHKLFGPTGVGVLYGKKALLEQMPPYQGGGDMIASVTFEKTTYNALPYKFEAGTPHVAGVIGLGAAIDYWQQFSWSDVAAHEQSLLTYGLECLGKIDGLRFIGTAKDKCAILSFVIDGIHAHDLGTLVDEDGIAIRTGHHCTQPVMQFFGVPATSRASLSVYNTKEELDRLAASLVRAQKIFA